MKTLEICMVVVCTILAVFGCVSYARTAEEEGVVKVMSGTIVLQDFEENHFWIPVGDFWNDGDASLTATNSTKNVTSGKTSLECTFKFKDVENKENKNENAKYRTKEATYYNDAPGITDWSMFSKLMVDVTNATDKELEIAFAVCTGNDWLWMNSDVYPLKPGLNKDFTFDLTAQTYKSSLTMWENTSTLANLDNVKRVIFRLSGPVGLEGAIYLDNIRLSE